MPDQVTNYQCPACGGPLHFDTQAQKLVCDYCGSQYTNEEINEYYAEHNAAAVSIGAETAQDVADVLQWSEEEREKLRAYSCPSCGAQLICDKNTAATSCPYCGNPTIVPSQFEGALKPDYVIPFKLDKDEAVRKLKGFYKGKPMLPKAFSDDNHIEEIKGVYVPFWLYDSLAAVNASYRAERVHTRTEGDYRVTITERYRLVRKGTVEFARVPTDASSKMPDALMDTIEPYDYKEMVDFDMAYMPGYLADKYDVSADEDSKRAETRMKNSAIQQIAATTVGAYSGVVPEYENVHIDQRHVHYAFLPVWMLSTKWNGQNYLFAMNGQTGKMTGDLPVDNMRFIMFFLMFTLLIGIAIFALMYFAIL